MHEKHDSPTYEELALISYSFMPLFHSNSTFNEQIATLRFMHFNRSWSVACIEVETYLLGHLIIISAWPPNICCSMQSISNLKNIKFVFHVDSSILFQLEIRISVRYIFVFI